MIAINKLLGAVVVGAVVGASPASAMCAAAVTDVPVQLPYDRTTSVFKTGETMWHITQHTVIDIKIMYVRARVVVTRLTASN